MVFNGHDAIGGFKHLQYRWSRKLSRRPDHYYLDTQKQSSSQPVEPFQDYAGKPATCPVCGYAMMRVTLKDNWSVETCSAYPAIPPLNSAQFNEWLLSLPDTKLPTTCV